MGILQRKDSLSGTSDPPSAIQIYNTCRTELARVT
jgi:hypothetical protein